MSNIKQLEFADFATIDGGRIALAMEAAIKRAAEDCHDRPGEKAGRKVTLEIVFVPKPEDNGLCERVASAIQVKETMPTRKSKVYDFGLRRRNVKGVESVMLTYSPESLDNVNQDSFDFGAQEKDGDK